MKKNGTQLHAVLFCAKKMKHRTGIRTRTQLAPKASALHVPYGVSFLLYT